MCCFEASVQRPKILFPSFLRSSRIATDSTTNRSSEFGHVQLVSKYISKVKLSREQSPNILSEIIKSQENGSKGRKISTGTFTKG